MITSNFSRAEWLIFIINKNTDIKFYLRKLFSCETVGFYGNEILWTFLNSQSKARKAIDTIRVTLNKIHLSLFKASLRGLFQSFSRHAFDHFRVFFIVKKKRIHVHNLHVCPLIDDKFRHNIVNVYCGITRLRLVVPRPLSKCYDAIYHQ